MLGRIVHLTVTRIRATTAAVEWMQRRAHGGLHRQYSSHQGAEGRPHLEFFRTQPRLKATRSSVGGGETNVEASLGLSSAMARSTSASASVSNRRSRASSSASEGVSEAESASASAVASSP
eukprot:3327741-Pleurochrysis_carterae.AAC.3